MSTLKPHKESWTKDEVKKIFKRHGVYYFMPAMGRYGRAGVPDFTACVNGFFIGVETKVVGKHPTDIQMLEGEKIRKANGIYVVVDETNLHDLSELLLSLQ